MVPALVVVAVLLAWSHDNGGFAAASWYGGALLVLALAVAVAAGGRALAGRLPAPARIAIAALAAYTAWSYASIAWADAQATAWDGANRTLLYLLVFALFAAIPLGGRRGAVVLGAWTLGVAAIAVWVLLDLPDLPDGRRAILGPGLAYPTGYSNSTAALWLMAAWPALVLAARREVHPALRGAFAAAAVVLADVTLLSESRGSLIAAGIVGILMFAAVPGRVRLLVTLVPVAVAAGLAAPRVLDVANDLQTDPTALLRIDTVRGPIFAAALVAGVVVACGALAEALAPASERMRGRASRVVGALGIAVALTGGVVAVAAAGDPAHRVRTTWDSFQRGTAPTAPGEGHLRAGFGGARYDYYRVALDVFREHPLAGIGADNFAQDYLARGRAIEAPAYPHSIELRAVVQTGIVGAVLLAIALGAAVAGGWSNARRRPGLAGGAAAGGLLVFAQWFVQGSADWFWEFPALGGAAFAMLGLACGARAPDPAPAGDGAPARRLPRVGAVAVAATAGTLALCAAASFALPWMSAIEVRRATRSWTVSPAAAYRQLHLAADLNPLSPQPALTEGAIALRRGATARARGAFERALARDPRNAYAVLELGALASAAGRRTEARALLRRAVALNPQDAITQTAHDTIAAGKRIDVAAMNEQMVAQARDLQR